MKSEEIQSHRKRLNRLAQILKAQSIDENTFQYCTPELWKLYDGTNPAGRAIYKSFSDGELLAILNAAALELGRALKQNEIYCVYRQYIRLRFGNWPRALEAAGLRIPKRFLSNQTAEHRREKIGGAL